MVKKKENLKTNMSIRPPIVVVLGHVDHGKSSLLEAIRDFKITSKESGGITQHIGAYEVEERGKKITFIDTPGHEAFSAMRARGAKVADIAILVIDTTDCVQSQTKEAINVIKQTKIPLIVALNKIDKPTADPERIKRELAKSEIIVESLGGKIPAINISAKTKQGIDELLEMILLVAEIEKESLETELNVPAEGIVIESYLDCFRGPLATLIVKKGILKKKDIIGTFSTFAKIKNMENFQGKPIEEAYPSQPVVILGFERTPGVGEEFNSYKTTDEAIAHIRKTEEKNELLPPVIEPKEGQKIINIILKADVMGSLEAISNVLKELPQDKIVLRILKEEIGDINESDIKSAEVANAQIVGFRVKIHPSVLQAMRKDKNKKVKIKTFEVIYDLIQEIRQMMEKSLEPEVSREEIGKVKVLVVFWGEKNRQIIGGKIIQGELKKGLKIEVWRKEEKIGGGKLINLQRNKKDVEKLVKGDECGIMFEGNVKIQEGDILICYTEERRRGEL